MKRRKAKNDAVTDKPAQRCGPAVTLSSVQLAAVGGTGVVIPALCQNDTAN